MPTTLPKPLDYKAVATPQRTWRGWEFFVGFIAGGLAGFGWLFFVPAITTALHMRDIVPNTPLFRGSLLALAGGSLAASIYTGLAKRSFWSGFFAGGFLGMLAVTALMYLFAGFHGC